MDGPFVNWKFYELLQNDLKNQHNFQILCLGSCGLHILNNSFKHREKATNWNINSILSSLYWLFKDAPVRREDLMKLSSSEKFPLKFCCHRWLENVPCAERAIEIWTDILAKMLQPFLVLYQSYEPLVPFLAGDLFTLVKSMLEHFQVLKHDKCKSIDSISSLCSFYFADVANFNCAVKVSIGFIDDELLKKKRAKKEALDKDVLDLKVDKSLIPSKDGYEILLQFKEFLDKVVKCSFSDFKTLDHKEQRLDTFLYQYFSVDKEKYRKLWNIVKMILILSHGQATVERGFSLKKASEIENLKENSYIAQRMIIEAIKEAGDVLDVPIIKKMRISVQCTGNTVIKSVKVLKDHGVKEDNIILLNLFCTPHAANSVMKAYPAMTILTSEVHPVAPNHFGQKYFGTD
ncbi:Uracil phosphoribosyltransferase [Araneus ventricosus]|uniref:Uracil phosphoribosyltransferase n=1 Tax=Araneus ventricosus TaxID=182803 RepID=A0A4Y2T3G2_ARAVE|nr:Uracil phosphoribosyltransferase [Araneus ventricosus]